MLKKLLPTRLYNSFMVLYGLLTQKNLAADIMQEHGNDLVIRKWITAGMPNPAPTIVKHRTMLYYQKKFNFSTFIETGTYLGNTLEFLRPYFNKLISIELSPEYRAKAQKRFAAYPHIELMLGDSGEVLQQLAPTFTQPCMFWLDGHYSGGETAKGTLNTPIIKELQAILGTKIDHFILIDDARCFDGTKDYPSIQQLAETVQSLRPDYVYVVKEDIIRFFKPYENYQNIDKKQTYLQ